MQKALIALIALGLNLVACNKSETAPSADAAAVEKESTKDSDCGKGHNRECNSSS